MWNIKPSLLCNRHLLGEHLETHMFLGAIRKGKSLKGYIDNGLVETDKIKSRHDLLADEMINRGMNHKSPMEHFKVIKQGKVDTNRSINDLINRCSKCRERINKYGI